MPEGHVLHRLAARFNELFADEQVQVSSPQGRFAESAALIDGSTLVQAQAWGKHLFVRFDAPIADPIVHIHLGLIGKLSFTELAPPVGQVRVRINDDTWAADLRGPQICRLISEDEEAAATKKLGADPLRSDSDPERAWTKVHRSGKPIASLLMNQAIFAGVGNIYRAEVLFRHRIDPQCPGNKLHRASFDLMWNDLVQLMRLGVRDGRIDTVYPEHTPEALGRPPRVDAHGGEVYVYRRADQPCLVCGSPIHETTLEGRHLFWCGRCQRRH
ncbi:Fpg/Nei family DNA glycosylase [Propionibacterium freudenreichii]|uniref:Fpg/Nei family DNA glycosylase n=1 Tax=Propionibacterium freudenreichii TaxID=1744 RepID=UPI00049F1E8B|nr:DNA-formamidopyrimidine glycosylase family protein [Propionibacterium freudenreichii]AWY96157.1 Endonuclease VIII and DNA N-glycosylase with an AP lyase activity [Propionibacterium freudenreichii]MCT3018813.1 Fpg/Nei family DNA glycosylase [Propionibacterium freudenreichii]MDK9640871.1 Fpg/Nei family DNA glycosylase [Propionibacterium freudenreichii]WBF60394.1 Fpg/Nei family DNA glycosylase [Propionibacterium freudenreichii]WBF62761.1 Fpg/Nei family DNA glycosylase [Propionibacterium freude